MCEFLKVNANVTPCAEATLCERNKGYFPVNQYENPDNPDAYYRTLGPEIWRQTRGKVTHFIAGGSTGGTVSGTGRFLKARRVVHSNGFFLISNRPTQEAPSTGVYTRGGVYTWCFIHVVVNTRGGGVYTAQTLVG